MNKYCIKCQKIIVDYKSCYCRECNREYGKENYRKNKDRYFQQAKKRDGQIDKLINSYKSKPCMDCGIQYPPFVMDFDHLGLVEKEHDISAMRRRRMAFDRIVAEISKCEVVCSNCHRIRTNTRNPARYYNQNAPSAT